ncbi:tetratricopeptide repeat protein [Pontibacter sp. JH31]|uniref:Tetratricopeptide repeat protein n=1 Tax=Pontibacter aquaedesilientis TaxID=2766980 RepID=A0ABR7XCT3_9BACT|nr:tetratricopeptide repeat protein [Pontibacter aquaedesilientis]MBD1396115.1 tetratricopeptide repeat protein [Pontibacter aquaedesilientis]
MKKILMTALAAASVQVAVAQNSAVNSAVLNHKNGTLDKALADINKATEHKKTQDKAKTWFYHGVINQDLIGHPIYGKVATEKTPEVVLQSFNKTIELDGKDGQFGKQVPERLEMLYGQILNQAVEFHNNQDWDNAIAKYDLASSVNPTDTTAILYAAYASTAKQDYSKAAGYYDKLISVGHATEDVFKAKIQLLQAAEASDDKVMASIAEGLKKHPNSVYLMQEELRYYLKNDRAEEAMDKLDKAIQADPKNASLYAVRGNLQERKGNLDEAYKNYQKAVEMDPNNFDGFFNLGVLEYNKGSEFNNKAAKMDYATYKKQGAKLEAQAKKHYEASLPYFEKALEIQPEDQATLANLQRVYTRLKRTADAERVGKKLKN